MTVRTVAVLIGRSPSHRYSIYYGYIDAVAAVDCQPVVIPAGPGICADRATELVAKCDALLLTGGNDVDPSIYGAVPGLGEKDTDVDRDAVEVAALSVATRAGRPVLGICRGIQLLAAARGGTLIPDLPSAGFTGHDDEERQAEIVHSITAEAGSVAARVLAGHSGVNSIHHQAVASPGPDLVATAWSPDGVIEAVEAPGLLGIQWHPERLPTTDPAYLAPFRWLVEQ